MLSTETFIYYTIHKLNCTRFKNWYFLDFVKAILPIKERKVRFMDKTFHPVSGEEVYLVTKDEKAIINIALEIMNHFSEKSGSE